MMKSWLISLLVLIFLALAFYFKIFDWLASASAFWIALGLVVIMLLIAFLVLGNPLKN